MMTVPSEQRNAEQVNSLRNGTAADPARSPPQLAFLLLPVAHPLGNGLPVGVVL
jgi:hypothetical protein